MNVFTTENNKLYTDCPVVELGDEYHKLAPIREVRIVSYDGDKYCTVIIEGTQSSIKTGYIYTEKGRCGRVPVFNIGNFKTPENNI